MSEPITINALLQLGGIKVRIRSSADKNISIYQMISYIADT